MASGVPVFEAQACKTQLDKKLDYVCSLPFYAIDTMFELQPNVPKRRERIVELKDHFFDKPRNYPDEGITCAVHEGENCEALLNQLKPICPPEMRDAYRMAIGLAVLDPKTSTDDLDAWFAGLCSVQFRIKVTPRGVLIDSMFKDICQSREDIGKKWENIRCSNLMRSYEVMDLKVQLEPVKGKLKPPQVAALYGEIKLASTSEAVSATFVEVSVMLHGGPMKNPDVRDVCFKFDARGLQNPMDSVHKIREVVIACNKNDDDMSWAFPMLYDWWLLTDAVEPIPLRALKGTVPGHGGKSLVDLLLLKRNIRDKLYTTMDRSCCKRLHRVLFKSTFELLLFSNYLQQGKQHNITIKMYALAKPMFKFEQNM